MARRRALVALCSLAAAGAWAASEPTAPAARPRVLELSIGGAITTGTAEYVDEGLERARRDGYDALLIRMDTPGGGLDATRDIVQHLLASPVPTLVWVGPAGARAGSAGLFITMAANVAAMDPTSEIGASHPVTSGGKDVAAEAGKDMAKKVLNDTAAFARSIAKSRGRNVEWAERAVRESVSATAEEALKLKVIDAVEPDVPSLLAFADGRTVEVAGGRRTLRTRDATVEPLPMTVRQRTLSFLADPNVAALLFLVGTLGIALELYHPGSIAPGVAGGVCLLLAFLAMRVIPVNVGALLLLALGVGLLVAEAYVTTHGLVGAAGAVCIVVGTLLFIDRSSPDFQFNPGAFELSPAVVWPTPIALSAILGFAAWMVVRSRKVRIIAGSTGLVGERGETISAVGPEGGEVFVHGEYWKARAEEPLPARTRVVVVKVDGLVAVVRPEPGPAAPSKHG